jgi:hypothetical protein
MSIGAHRVRIIAIPPGEAPPWVREQWVGLELPLAQSSREARSRRVFGVLSGPRNLLAWWLALISGRAGRETGYAVRVMDALTVLEKKSPEAAAWWRTNVPHMQSPLRCFLFAGSVCQVLDESERRFER